MNQVGTGDPGRNARGSVTGPSTARGAGVRGEELAARYLEDRGYRVLERNFRTRRGEIDIVAQRGERVVFVEVKHWQVFGTADLGQAVGRTKQNRIRAASQAYLMRHPEIEGSRIGYDVVLVAADGGRTRHYQNAFDGV